MSDKINKKFSGLLSGDNLAKITGAIFKFTDNKGTANFESFNNFLKIDLEELYA